MKISTLKLVAGGVALAVSCMVQAVDMTVRYSDYSIKDGQALLQSGNGGILKHKGYLNQPVFSSDGSRLLWTQQSGPGPMDTDIYYQVLGDSKPGQPLVNTKFGEFSATPMPMQPQQYSVVRVEADGTQRLWQIGAGKDELLLPEVKGVGYHAWGADGDLLLFLLADQSGPNRAVYRSKDGQLTTLAGHIGRSLVYQGSTDQFYFTAPLPDMPENAEQWLWRYQAGAKAAKPVLPLPADGQDLAVTSQGTLLVSSGRYILQLKEQSWLPWLDLRQGCAGKVTRFKLNPVKPMLAYVCQEKG